MNSQAALIIMVLGGALALWGLKLRKKNKGLGIFVSVTCSVLVLAVAGQRLWQELNKDALHSAKVKRTTEARGEVLGAYIAAAYPDARVLVLRSPSFPGMDLGALSEETILTGIRRGLPTEQVVKELALPVPQSMLDAIEGTGSEEEADMLMYELYDLGSWFTAEAFDQFITEHRDEFDLILTLTSLPDDLESSKVLGAEGAPPIACAGYSNFDIDEFIRRGVIVASISQKREGKGPSLYKVKLPETSQDIFDLWYEIITPENVSPALESAAPTA